MASLNLGKVGLLLRGDWDSDTDYAALDVVSHDGYAYAARVANKNVEPSAETAAYWQPLAESASVLATMLGYKNDAADSATAAAGSATAAATSASSATDALANEAADFSSSKAYAVGDYVIYNNGTHKYLYRFTAAHSAGAWIGTDAAQVALADDVGDLKSALDKYNCVDVLANATRNSGTVSGITWTWNSDGSCTVSTNGGQSTAAGSRKLAGGSNIMPDLMVAGGRYFVKYSGTNVYLRIRSYNNNTEIATENLYSDKEIVIPSNATGVFINLNVSNGKTVSETVNPVILTAKTNKTLTENIETCFRGETLVSSSSGLSDFNNAVINRYYSINVASGISNMPVEKKGHLLYFGLEGGETTPKSGREVQMYITHDNEFWYRGNKFSSGAPFADWRKLAAFDELPFPRLSSLSMFQSIGIIGDSFASGEIYDANAGTHADYYPLSWGQVLARMCGLTAVNYSKGGLTSKSWLTNTDYGLAKMNADPVKNLYIIALGINDANHSDTIPVGSSSDITSDDTASFYSYYGRIIRAIKAHAPSAVIMLSTLARFGNTYNPYSEAVRTIGEYYDLIVLDLAENDYFQSSFFSSHQISNHPTAVNYSGMAKAYKDMIEKAIDANASDFDGYVG